MKVDFCRCRQCRYCRHHAHGQAQIKRAQRHGKRLVKMLIKKWEFDKIPEKIHAGYL